LVEKSDEFSCFLRAATEDEAACGAANMAVSLDGTDDVIRSLRRDQRHELARVVDDLIILHEVGDSVVVEGGEHLLFERLLEADLVRDIEIEELEDVEPVGSLRGSRHAQEEFGLQVVEHLAVCSRSSPMNFVEEDVVKVRGRNLAEIVRCGQRLNRREHVLAIELTPRTDKLPELSRGCAQNAAELLDGAV